ncbi:hypothetical protein JOL62DRAFT_254349 [Phyllosticta paracitricarpa]|uniref:Uncharacterized protein n=1 Tax=Phyllosticta paracitricarpa TaxID=2016321 RepID=A0ABR1MY22_9PEZI
MERRGGRDKFNRGRSWQQGRQSGRKALRRADAGDDSRHGIRVCALRFSTSAGPRDISPVQRRKELEDDDDNDGNASRPSRHHQPSPLRPSLIHCALQLAPTAAPGQFPSPPIANCALLGSTSLGWPTLPSPTDSQNSSLWLWPWRTCRSRSASSSQRDRSSTPPEQALQYSTLHSPYVFSRCIHCYGFVSYQPTRSRVRRLLLACSRLRFVRARQGSPLPLLVPLAAPDVSQLATSARAPLLALHIADSLLPRLPSSA